MRTSQTLLATRREDPHDAEIVSHKLMLRAGLIQRLASGLYNWLPTGLRVLHKVENIVREEMNRAGAIECLMPSVQPAELWRETDRFDHFGPELLRFKDRHNRNFCLGPTHEEIITDFARQAINSYKQLPMTFYQIQTKFRDEIRPRFGVMRSREFLMKDAYSFHLTLDSLDESYQTMYSAYSKIFERLGLEYRAVLADTGAIGGSSSHEFHVLADSGEDLIAFSDESEYAANIEMAPLSPITAREAASESQEKVHTPNLKSIDEVSKHLNISADKTVKVLIVKADTETVDHDYIALVLRGDHTLNDIKAEKHPWIQAPLELANPDSIRAGFDLPIGFIGPFGLPFPLIVDHAASGLHDFVAGANEVDYHFTGCNWERDFPLSETADIRNIEAGDPSPCGKGTIALKRGIEVGHIFKLGDKYSEAMKATVLDESGKARAMHMGCYGVGVSRLVAACIEQSHDEKGIIWPDAIAPFQCAILPMNYHKSTRVQETANALYQTLSEAGIEVLLDDRKDRPGVLFKDIELIGVPHVFVIGDRSLDEGVIEYQNRRVADREKLKVEEALSFIQRQLS